MKGSTKAVGGSPVSAGAKDFTNFLTQGLSSGNFGPQSFQQNAFGQTIGMGGAIDKLLSGNVGDPTSLTEMFRNGSGMANFGNINSGFSASPYSNINFNTLPSFQSGYTPPVLSGPQNIDPSNFQGAFDQVNKAAGYSLDDIRSVMNDELQRQVLTQNASLAGSGGGFMSSGKALGEELLRRDAPSRLGLALSQIGDTKANQALNLLGINQQGQIANQQAGLNFGNQQLTNAGQQAQFAQGAAGLNADVLNQLNQLMLQQSMAGNQYNQSNEQFGSSQDLNAQIAQIQAMLQNQQLGNQNQLGLGQLFQGFQQNQIGSQQNMLGMLFNAFNQLNALGTPQAQMVQQKSPFEQITGGIGNILGMAQPFFGQGGFQNPFGGGMPSLPSQGPGVGFTGSGWKPPQWSLPAPRPLPR